MSALTSYTVVLRKQFPDLTLRQAYDTAKRERDHDTKSWCEFETSYVNGRVDTLAGIISANSDLKWEASRRIAWVIFNNYHPD